VAMQIVLLGAILVVFGTLSDMMYALAAGSVGNWLRGNLKFLRAQRYFAGSVYLGLGAATALGGTHKKYLRGNFDTVVKGAGRGSPAPRGRLVRKSQFCPRPSLR